MHAHTHTLNTVGYGTDFGSVTQCLGRELAQKFLYTIAKVKLI